MSGASSEELVRVQAAVAAVARKYQRAAQVAGDAALAMQGRLTGPAGGMRALTSDQAALVVAAAMPVLLDVILDNPKIMEPDGEAV